MSPRLFNFFPTKAEEEAAAAEAVAAAAQANGWMITKVLIPSDLDIKHRLNLPQGGEHGRAIQEHIISYLYPDTAREVLAGRKQIINMKDVDDGTEVADMAIKRDLKWNVYYIQGHWRSKFVVRRNLQVGDQIGLRWNVQEHCLEFSTLN